MLQVVNSMNNGIRRLHIDKGGDIMSACLDSFCTRRGILHEHGLCALLTAFDKFGPPRAAADNPQKCALDYCSCSSLASPLRHALRSWLQILHLKVRLICEDFGVGCGPCR